MNGHCEVRNDINTLLNTGDFVSSSWSGPRWTPYAERIANHYRRIVPWFLSIPSGLTAPPSRRTIVTKPYQNDVLIFGASAFVTGGTTGLDGNFIYLQVTHEETGLTWATPNVLNSAPLPAYAGINLRSTPILPLPDVFFLPKHTSLRLDWSATAFADQAFNARLTFVGVQLIDPFGGEAPREITMPDGKTIRVGDRIPWFGTCGLGVRDSLSALEGAGFFIIGASERAQFLISADCDVEIHDLYANFLGTAPTADTANLVVKIVDMGTTTNWNPTRSPVAAIFGSELGVNPGLPFTKPYLLKKNHRLSLLQIQNATAGGALIQNGLFTVRGVRLCEY